MPTLKQKKAFKEITENHRSVSAAMRKVGYKKNTAVKPSNLTNSKGWKELMEQVMPDKLLAQKHLALLNKTKVIYTIAGDAVDTNEIDVTAVRYGLDMAYKLKNKYPKEGNVTAVQVNINRIREEFK